MVLVVGACVSEDLAVEGVASGELAVRAVAAGVCVSEDLAGAEVRSGAAGLSKRVDGKVEPALVKSGVTCGV